MPGEWSWSFLVKNVTCACTTYGASIARSSYQRCSVKKMLLKISQFSWENTCVGVSLIKLQGWRPATLLKKYSNTQVFSCEIWKTLKKTYFEEHLQTTASAAQVLFTDFQQKCITTIFRTLFNVFTTFVVV